MSSNASSQYRQSWRIPSWPWNIGSTSGGIRSALGRYSRPGSQPIRTTSKSRRLAAAYARPTTRASVNCRSRRGPERQISGPPAPLWRHQIKDDGRSSSVKEASVTALQTDALELAEVWSETDPDRGARFNFPISMETGAASTAVVYFELPPASTWAGTGIAPRRSSSSGAAGAEAVVGEQRLTVEAGGLAPVPARVPHDVINVGAGASSRLLLELDRDQRLRGAVRSDRRKGIRDAAGRPAGARRAACLDRIKRRPG